MMFGLFLWLFFQLTAFYLIVQLLFYQYFIRMGIQAIKSGQQKHIHPIPMFDFQGMIKVNTQPIENQYIMMNKLGEGTYGQVFLAIHKRSKKRRAIKKINLLKFPRIKATTLSEISLLKSLDHPNIMKIYEVYEQANFEYIVSECCQGKQLFDIILQKHYFSQEEACFIFYEIISAVRAMNANFIMHRDLKPQNIMYDYEGKTLKIIDFGSAVRYQNSQLKVRKRVGTSYYIAPEVLARNYNEKCDIWSIGVILYILLVGEVPFNGKNDYIVMQNIAKGQPLKFTSQLWKGISQKAKNLIKKMLNRNIQQRLSVIQVMQDPWITQQLFKRTTSSSNKKLQKTITNHLRNLEIYKNLEATALQEGFLIFIVNFVKDKKGQEELAQSFKQLDLNKDGVISLQQMQIGLSKYLKMPKNKTHILAKQIFQKVDTNRSGSLDFSQFMVSAQNIQLTVNEQNLDIAFDYIDEDRSGRLSVQQVRNRLGTNINESIYNSLLAQYDINHDGQLSKEQFKVMMKGLIKKIKKIKK